MKLLISGLSGRTGRELFRLIKDGTDGFRAVAGVCRHPIDGEIPCFSSFSDVTVIPDCIVDASHPSLTEELLDFAVSRGVPTVIATTGRSAAQENNVLRASGRIPIFRSANFALGLGFLAEVAEIAASIFPEAQTEIIETHHDRKRDAPSGTALALAQRIIGARGGSITAGRHGTTSRSPQEIGIHSVRLGNAVGKHEILFYADGQTFTLTHEVHERRVYAQGILRAARFLTDLPKGTVGLFDMKDFFGAFSVKFKDFSSFSGGKI